MLCLWIHHKEKSRGNTRNMLLPNMSKKTMKRIGLTGMMGAGKSSVIDILRQMKIMVLDCDAINSSLLQKGARGYIQLCRLLKDDILDAQGNIVPQRMSALMFQNEAIKQQVEAILHPMIKEAILQEIKQHEQEALVVVEVPLLFEVHWESFFDEVWVVGCAQEVLLERLQKYRHIEKEEALRRIAYQMPQEEKFAKADVIFMNDRDKAYLQKQIVQEVERIEREILC